METRPLAGIHRTRDLADLGWRQTDIRRALANQHLRRLRQGWYAVPDAHPGACRAVAAGGALGCASALAFHGAWDVTGQTVHVRRDHNRDEALPAGLVSCRPPGRCHRQAPAAAVDPLPVALQAAWKCLTHEDFIVVCDSLLDRQLVTMSGLEAVLGDISGASTVLSRCAWAESGTETMVRLRLQARGLHVRTQVAVPGVGRVDLLLGDRLVIEVDSIEHHTGLETYRRDRERDLALRRLGYIVVRLTYQQVLYDWPTTERSLLAMVRRGDHWTYPGSHGFPGQRVPKQVRSRGAA